ncbi:MAG: MATE family efflux transporter [Heliobacteriaceae bacterium]|jgi:MATE family multidrug resistance protein|nr:MATE family efflux transporter [Heliobacteriaceae bacterium]
MNFSYYAKELLSIALSIIMGNLGFILIGAGDVLIAGRHSTDTLAAVGIATAILNCLIIFGIGLISSITPILSNIRGEGQSAAKYFYPTLRFAFFISVIIMIAILAVIPLIDLMGFEQSLVKQVKDFMFITAFSTFVIYLHGSLKEFLQAHEIVFFPNLLNLICVVFNVALCALFVFGCGPVPSMGVVGIAAATFIVRTFMAVVLLIYCYKIMHFEDYTDREYYKSIFKIGLPISLAILIEFAAFNSIAVLMGRISSIYAAAQNLVAVLMAVFFMIPLAISNAIAVKVGFANGSGNLYDLKNYSFTGIFISAGFMLCSGVILAVFPEFFVKLFTSDAALIKITVPILYIAAMFQIFDGLQVSLSGVFKGIKKTGVVMLANLTAYWFVSFPLGCALAFKYKLYLAGFWYAFIFGGILLCLIMFAFLVSYLRRRAVN